MHRYFKAIFILALVIFSSNFAFSVTKISDQLPKTLPASALYDLRGGEFTLDKLEGNVLLIHFWATWCATCVDEMKSLNKLQELLRKDPVIVIPVSEDFKGAKTVKDFYNKYNLRFLPAFLDKNNRWFKEMKVANLPATFIIDSQGRNVLHLNGEVDWLDEKNIELVKKYISGKLPYNQDYVSLLGEHSAVDIKTEAKNKHNNNKESLLRSIETDVSLEVDEEQLENGEIAMSSPRVKESLKDRRPVNLNINGGK
jgi:thiol-disulfide isomerase/thioredoxin